MTILECADPSSPSCQLRHGFDPWNARREHPCRDRRHALLHDPLGDRDGGGLRARRRTQLAVPIQPIRAFFEDFTASVMAQIGYARVSTRTQNDDSQVDDLTAYGCCLLYTSDAADE